MNYLVKKGIFITCVSFLSITVVAQQIPEKDIKKNITVIDSPLEKLTLLEPRIFEYNIEGFKSLQLPSGKQFGFMADNIQDVFPGLVTIKNISYPVGKNSSRTAHIKTVSMENLIPLLVASVKEQQVQIQKLKTEIEELKKYVKP